MEKTNVIAALAALAQDNRLDVFRLLVAAGPAGLPAGQIATVLGLPPNTLSFHFDRLRVAGLVTVRRIVRGRDPLKAGRDHVHHVLLHAGFSPAQTVGLMLLASLLFAMAGFVAWRMGVPDWVMFCAFMALFALYYGLSRRAWRIVRFLKKFRSADAG